MISLVGELCRYPATAAVSAATVLVGALQLFTPVVSLFERDSQRIASGQWWRVMTSMFVQGDGWGQFVFNVLGLVIVGSAVEMRLGGRRLLVLYFGGGVATGLTMSLWFPHQVDSGSSAGVASLIGALTLAMVLTRSLAPWPAFLYSLFFCVYLAGLALGGPIVGSIAGSLTVALTVALRNRAEPRTVRGLNLLAFALCTVALLISRDVHGVGLASGCVLFFCIFRWVSSADVAKAAR